MKKFSLAAAAALIGAMSFASAAVAAGPLSDPGSTATKTVLGANYIVAASETQKLKVDQIASASDFQGSGGMTVKHIDTTMAKVAVALDEFGGSLGIKHKVLEDKTAALNKLKAIDMQAQADVTSQDLVAVKIAAVHLTTDAPAFESIV